MTLTAKQMNILLALPSASLFFRNIHHGQIERFQQASAGKNISIL